jgi:hypothetical protein
MDTQALSAVLIKYTTLDRPEGILFGVGGPDSGTPENGHVELTRLRCPENREALKMVYPKEMLTTLNRQ